MPNQFDNNIVTFICRSASTSGGKRTKFQPSQEITMWIHIDNLPHASVVCDEFRQKKNLENSRTESAISGIWNSIKKMCTEQRESEHWDTTNHKRWDSMRKGIRKIFFSVEQIPIFFLSPRESSVVVGSCGSWAGARAQVNRKDENSSRKSLSVFFKFFVSDLFLAAIPSQLFSSLCSLSSASWSKFD